MLPSSYHRLTECQSWWKLDYWCYTSCYTSCYIACLYCRHAFMLRNTFMWRKSQLNIFLRWNLQLLASWWTWAYACVAQDMHPNAFLAFHSVESVPADCNRGNVEGQNSIGKQLCKNQISKNNEEWQPQEIRNESCHYCSSAVVDQLLCI